jgi:predicted lipoprotein with Yx(FWY)xxD motif
MAAASLATAAVIGLAACGSSSKKVGAASPSTSAPAAASVTIAATNVPGVGTVLVNASDGKTLYLLTSEKGGKLTCTDANGCTKVWPDTELPAGVTQATAGKGVQASMLGTVKNTAGNLYVTYGGWPLYEYSGDPGPGMANGQAIVSFGGTWWALNAAGQPVTTAAGGSSTSTTSGYKY